MLPGLGDEIEVTEAGGHRERDEEAEGDGEQLRARGAAWQPVVGALPIRCSGTVGGVMVSGRWRKRMTISVVIEAMASARKR